MPAYDLSYVFGYTLIHCDDIRMVSLDSRVRKLSAGDTDPCQQLYRVTGADACHMGWLV